MIVLDANLLLYAYNADAAEHKIPATWLEKVIHGPEVIALLWPTIWAFVRISTNARIMPVPKPAKDAFAIVRSWLEQPGVVVLNPGPRHAEILEELVSRCNASGPLLSDAVLAALAIENGAELASTDRDFSRFPQLRWVNPVEPRRGS